MPGAVVRHSSSALSFWPRACSPCPRRQRRPETGPAAHCRPRCGRSSSAPPPRVSTGRGSLASVSGASTPSFSTPRDCRLGRAAQLRSRVARAGLLLLPSCQRLRQEAVRAQGTDTEVGSPPRQEEGPQGSSRRARYRPRRGALIDEVRRRTHPGHRAAARATRHATLARRDRRSCGQPHAGPRDCTHRHPAGQGRGLVLHAAQAGPAGHQAANCPDQAHDVATVADR